MVESGYNNNLTRVGRDDEEDKGGWRVNNSVWIFFSHPPLLLFHFPLHHPLENLVFGLLWSLAERYSLPPLRLPRCVIVCVSVCVRVFHSSVSSGCSYPGRAMDGSDSLSAQVVGCVFQSHCILPPLCVACRCGGDEDAMPRPLIQPN